MSIIHFDSHLLSVISVLFQTFCDFVGGNLIILNNSTSYHFIKFQISVTKFSSKIFEILTYSVYIMQHKSEKVCVSLNNTLYL